MMQVHALACRKLHKETFMCQGGCCGLSPVHTRPCENVLVSEFLRESFEQVKLSGLLCGSQAVPVSGGILLERCRCQGGLLQCPHHRKLNCSVRALR